MVFIRNMPPLVVFLLLGGGVFALDSWLDDGSAERRVVEVTTTHIAGIRQRGVAQRGRPPTTSELNGLIDEAVREEILYREAQRLGLDQDDAIVRRRLAQKMTFMLEDTASVQAPSTKEIGTYYLAHTERYRRPGRTTFRHIFLSGDRRTDPAGDAHTLLEELQRNGPEGWQQLGDPFMLLKEYADRSNQEIVELFGDGFTDAVDQLLLGTWSGPIDSAYGTHLVPVLARTAPRALSLDEVRNDVATDLLYGRREEQNRTAFQRVRERYDVKIFPSDSAQP